MSTNSNSDSAGCLTIFGLLILIPVVIELVETLVTGLVELIEALIPFALVGCVGYGIYSLIQYNRRTRKIEETFEKMVGLDKPESNNTLQLTEGKDGKYGLPTPQPQATQKEEEQKLQDRINELESEMEIKITRAIQEYAAQQRKEGMQSTLEYVLGSPTNEYARSDEYERQKIVEAISKILFKVNSYCSK